MTLVVLRGAEDDRAALSAAERLGVGRGVVRVVAGADAEVPSADGWTLRTDAPVEPLLSFARRRRAHYIVLGAEAEQAWGTALWEAGAAAGVLSRRWTMPWQGARRTAFTLAAPAARPGFWNRAIRWYKDL